MNEENAPQKINIRNEFNFQKLTQEGIYNCNCIAMLFSELLTNIEKIVPEGRELALVKTKLEEASYFAKKAISKLDKYHHQSEAV